MSDGLFTQNGSDSLKCIAAQHCLSNWRRFFILFPENKTFFQIKLFCTFMVWRDIFWISLLSSVFLVQLSNVSPQPAFCPNYDCSDWKIIELFLASLQTQVVMGEAAYFGFDCVLHTTLPHPLFIVSLWIPVILAEPVGWVDFQEKKAAAEMVKRPLWSNPES